MKDRLQKDLSAAMKARQTARVSTLRLLLSQVKNEEIARGRPLSDPEVMSLIQRGIRSRRESVEQFERGGRADLVAKEHEEIGVLESYLPRSLSEAELRSAAESIIRELGAQGKKDMGRVMKTLMERHAGQVDGRQASELVSSLLK